MSGLRLGRQDDWQGGAGAGGEDAVAAGRPSGHGALDLPTTEQLARERVRLERGHRLRRATVEVLGLVAVAAAVAVLVSTVAFPMLRVYGDSMTPTLSEGDVVVAARAGSVERGDLMAFYLGNRILVKRVVGLPGDWVDLGDDGTLYINGQQVDEPYLPAGDRARGTVDIMLPYQVPDGRYFVMGDNRAVSLDSRTSSVGCVTRDQIVGRLALRVWPVASAGVV